MDPILGAALITGGFGLLGNLFGGGNKNKNSGLTFAPGTPMHEWLTTGMLPGSGGGGGSSTSTTTSNQTQNINRTITPFVTGEYAPGANLVRMALENRVRFPAQFPQGALANAITSTNRTYDVAEGALLNRLSAMGLTSSPAATVPLATLARGRTSDIAQFRNNLPMMQREMQTQDLQLLQSLIQTLGLGQREQGKITTSGTSTTKGSSSGSGSGPRFDPQGPLSYMQMMQQNRGTGFWDMLPQLGYMVARGVFDSKGSGKSTKA